MSFNISPNFSQSSCNGNKIRGMDIVKVIGNFFFQILVKVFDGGNPPRQSSEGKVKVTVIRNLNAPVFDDEVSEVTIDETLGTGNKVFGVKATDEDEVRESEWLLEYCFIKFRSSFSSTKYNSLGSF